MTIQSLDRTRPTARKAHRCDDCGRTIEPGETYDRQTNLGDDGLYTWKCCVQCEQLADRIYATDPYARDNDWGLDIGEWLNESQHPLCALFTKRWRDTDGVLVPVTLVAEHFEVSS